MPPASAAPAAPPAVPQDQHLPKQEPLPAASTPPSSVAATAAAATAAVGATPMNGNAGPVGENLICDWGECKQQMPNAEALYVCLLVDVSEPSTDLSGTHLRAPCRSEEH